MKRIILRLPFPIILTGIASVAMLAPMGLAFRLGEIHTAHVFLECGLLFFVLSALVAVASVNYRPRNTARSYLVSLLAALFLLPLILAYPLVFLVPDASFFELYFEMLSSLTTTGATLFDEPSRLSEPVHLWRALVAWLGGFLVLLSAVAIMAPLNLGGFEVYARPASRSAHAFAQFKPTDISERLVRFTRLIFPVYLAITVVLAVGLLASGERTFAATIHAMSTISTSGISGNGGLGGDGAGLRGEVLVFFFMFFAVSRVTFSFEKGLPGWKTIARDYEFRLTLGLLSILPVLLFLRHWFGAFEVNAQGNVTAAFRALWGSMFTVMSFLTTTGFESSYWSAARDWSGLHAPGILLVGLAGMGGGVATTAGGIKLLRVYALYKHGARELQKLTFPSSIGGAGGAARRIRREGAHIAWLFFMLFAISIAVVLLALTLTGLDFDQSLAFGVAALSTTGPLAGAVLETGGSYTVLNDWGRAVLGAAMVLGRLETLAIVALLNPEFWRS